MVASDDISAQRQVPESASGSRLDRTAAELFPDYSRNRIQQWIKGGQLTVDGKPARSSTKLLGGEWLDLQAELQTGPVPEAEDLPLDLVFEDDEVLVVDKPAGLVVHPAAGNPNGTLLNALLHHQPALAHLPRAGIVHRLDKDTTGLLVVAKTLRAHKVLVAALQAREVKRHYRALIYGSPVAGATIDVPIGRHPRDRKKMAVRDDGKPAVTHYRIRRRLGDFCLLNVQLESGRTHQIRVHLAHSGYPIVGDRLYGGRPRIPAGLSESQRQTLAGFKRQALHAARLEFEHPGSARWLTFKSRLPGDFRDLVRSLRGEA